MNSNRKLVYAYHSLLWPLVGLIVLLGFSMLSRINTPELREQIGQDYLLQQQQGIKRQIDQLQRKIEVTE